MALVVALVECTRPCLSGLWFHIPYIYVDGECVWMNVGTMTRLYAATATTATAITCPAAAERLRRRHRNSAGPFTHTHDATIFCAANLLHLSGTRHSHTRTNCLCRCVYYVPSDVCAEHQHGAAFPFVTAASSVVAPQANEKVHHCIVWYGYVGGEGACIIQRNVYTIVYGTI